jgi:LysM repeat protein
MSRSLSFLFVFICVCNLCVYSQTKNQAYLSYIESYYQLAQKQQQEYGIPASITLSQALLESGAGLGKLACISNNHFGIKCSDWQGEKVFHDDDQQGECFRKYEEVSQSFEDHSAFLKNKQRYAFLFELSPTDYQGWALGLKKAGYATDPNYAVKLINIIQDYELNVYDVCQSHPQNTPTDQAMPVTSISNGQFFGSMGQIKAYSAHEVFKLNGVEFVMSHPDDTYESICHEFEISVERLLRYNDISTPSKLKPGTRLFIHWKKCGTPRKYPTHKVLAGETLYRISQNYGVKLKRIVALNHINENDVLKVGQILKLRINFLFF